MPPWAALEWERTGWTLDRIPTFAPCSAAASAARWPASPAPITRTSCWGMGGGGILFSATGASRGARRLSVPMEGKLASPPVDRRLAVLAARQHGVVSRRQLHYLGLSDGAIDKRAGKGRLHRVHRGVFTVGHRLLTREGRFMAAVLACGEGAVLSHASAAVLWGILRNEGASVHVTVPGPGGRARRKAIV